MRYARSKMLIFINLSSKGYSRVDTVNIFLVIDNIINNFLFS